MQSATDKVQLMTEELQSATEALRGVTEGLQAGAEWVGGRSQLFHLIHFANEL